MRNLIYAGFIILTLLRCEAIFGQEIKQPKAYLRFETSQTGEPQYYVEVELFRRLKSDALRERDIIAALYNTKTQTQITNHVSASAAGETSFRMDIPLDEATIISQHENFQIAIHAYPTDDGIFSSIAPVETEVTIGIEKDARCKKPFRLSIILINEAATDYGRKRIEQLGNLLKQPGSERLVNILIERRDSEQLQTLSVTSLSLAGGTDILTICLVPDGNIPVSNFDLEFKFADSTPFELRQQQLLLTDLEGRNVEASVTGIVEKEEPGDRPLEKNLDLSTLLGSSVEEVEKPDKTKVRERTTRGTLDIRFAPWLKAPIFKLSETPRTRKYITPIYLDAKVSTGKITKDTLSLNRVIIGGEGEIRHYSSVGQYPNLQRYIIRLSNASDRDFKQAEYKVGFEFQPLFGDLNHYIDDEPNVNPNILDPDPKRGKKIFGEKFFGYQVQPVIGVEIGRTYLRRDPAEAVMASPTVRRFYFGGDITINLTSHFTLSLKDFFYVRGEQSNDRGHNYFNGTIVVPLANINDQTAHGLFLSFERGGQPPFTNPDVNVFKFGYRIRSNGWFRQFR